MNWNLGLYTACWTRATISMESRRGICKPSSHCASCSHKTIAAAATTCRTLAWTAWVICEISLSKLSAPSSERECSRHTFFFLPFSAVNARRAARHVSAQSWHGRTHDIVIIHLLFLTFIFEDVIWHQNMHAFLGTQTMAPVLR